MKHKNHPNLPTRDSRRRFTKAVASAFVAAPLAATASSIHDGNAQQKPPAAATTNKQAPAPPNPQPTPTPAPAKPSPAAEAYAEVLRVRFKEQLSPDELTRITRDLDGYVRTNERLRAFKLKNADEPDFIFIA
ncbi:MAG TPA: hypothetical protein VF666_18295 [Pyrinomonadaceae bacterium]|jgi:hypothetical protein